MNGAYLSGSQLDMRDAIYVFYIPKGDFPFRFDEVPFSDLR